MMPVVPLPSDRLSELPDAFSGISMVARPHSGIAPAPRDCWPLGARTPSVSRVKLLLWPPARSALQIDASSTEGHFADQDKYSISRALNESNHPPKAAVPFGWADTSHKTTPFSRRCQHILQSDRRLVESLLRTDDVGLTWKDRPAGTGQSWSLSAPASGRSGPQE